MANSHSLVACSLCSAFVAGVCVAVHCIAVNDYESAVHCIIVIFQVFALRVAMLFPNNERGADRSNRSIEMVVTGGEFIAGSRMTVCSLSYFRSFFELSLTLLLYISKSSCSTYIQA